MHNQYWWFWRLPRYIKWWILNNEKECRRRVYHITYTKKKMSLTMNTTLTGLSSETSLMHSYNSFLNKVYLDTAEISFVKSSDTTSTTTTSRDSNTVLTIASINLSCCLFSIILFCFCCFLEECVFVLFWLYRKKVCVFFLLCTIL